MKHEQLKRGNEIVKELDRINDQLEDYEDVLTAIDEDMKIEGEAGVEHIYHNNKNFTCSSKQYKRFVLSVQEEAIERENALIKEFENL